MSIAFRDRVAAYFKERPNTWIDGDVLRNVGGKYAYRTRISDCRLQLGMTIENRVRRIQDGVAISEYRYVPAQQPSLSVNADGQTCFL